MLFHKQSRAAEAGKRSKYPILCRIVNLKVGIVIESSKIGIEAKKILGFKNLKSFWKREKSSAVFGIFAFHKNFSAKFKNAEAGSERVVSR